MITPVDEPLRTVEVAYRLRRGVWGLGYDIEGMLFMIEIARSVQVSTVIATMMTVDVASRRLMEKAGLRDCPPGTNTVNAVQRPGDQLSVVTVAFKVLPDFKPRPPGTMKRPVATAADGTAYNTSVQFVDVGSVPEYSCDFVYRVPSGTVLKTLQIEDAKFDLSALDK
jgi:hypothetical protein